MRSKWKKVKVEEITLQVPSLDPRFAIFIDLCSCDFHTVESFIVQVNQSCPTIWFSCS